MRVLVLLSLVVIFAGYGVAKDAAIALQDVPKPVMDALRKEYPENKLISTGLRTVDG